MKTRLIKISVIRKFFVFASVLLMGSVQAELIFKSGFEVTYFIGGSSTDSDVVLQLNQNPNFNLMQNGAYAFPTAIESGQSYAVNLINSPVNKTCVVENAIGTINNSDVTNVNITCGTNTTIYDVKQGIATGLVAIDGVQIVSCWQGRGLTAQTLPGFAEYIGNDFSGVYLNNNNTDCNDSNINPQVGDQVNVVGMVIEFFGQTQLNDAKYTVISSDNTPAIPVLSTPNALSTLTAAPLEAVLVQVEAVTVIDIDVSAMNGDNDPTNEYIVSDDMNNELHIDDLLYLTAPFPALNDVFPTLTGILTYRHGNSKLLPRYSADAFIADPLADNLVINEVDYNQDGTDTNEFVEIFNPTGQSISLLNKTLYLVNGSNTNEYMAIDLDSYDELLSGQYLIIGSQNLLDTFNNGAIEVPFVGIANIIQNGPDGLLVIDRQTEVVEDALSYGGSIIATITALNNLVVNLVEGTATSEIDSFEGVYALSRISNGKDSDDALADWQVVGNISPGEANQTTDLNLGGLVINEVDYDQPVTDTDEFIELLNTTGLSMDLNGISLYLVNQSSLVYQSIDLSSITLTAGEYLVIGSETLLNTVSVEIQTIAFAGPANNIQNGDTDGILIFDDVNLTVVDALSYEGSLTAVDINGTTVSLVEGTATAASDNNVNVGSMIRLPNGQDTDNAIDDWSFTGNLTPGGDNQ